MTVIMVKVVWFLALATTASAWSSPKYIVSRRVALAWTSILIPTAAEAFDNKISNMYDDRPKRRGPKPPDLGVGKRTNLEGDEFVGLRGCGPAPNCFSSTIGDDEDHSLPVWLPPPNVDKEAAWTQLLEVIQSYPPGQNGVDGGGFAIQTVQPDYIYVQFESLKTGYIDDVEFARIEGLPGVQVRSSSRIGYLDFMVNAKRLNWLARSLRDRGWKADGVDPKTHLFYFEENQRS